MIYRLTPEYWTDHRLSIWRGLTPAQRDYDRYQGVHPPGQGICETAEGRAAIDQRADDIEYDRHACTCHRNPPCSHCTDCTECGES